MTEGPHVDDLLSAYMDDELDDATRARVETHLHTCSRCAAELESWRGLHAQLRDTEIPDPGAAYWSSFASRVQARLPAATTPGRVPWIERLAGWFLPGERIAWARVTGVFAVATLVTYAGMRGFEPDRARRADGMAKSQAMAPSATSDTAMTFASPAPEQAGRHEEDHPPRVAIGSQAGLVRSRDMGDADDVAALERPATPSPSKRSATRTRPTTITEPTAEGLRPTKEEPTSASEARQTTTPERSAASAPGQAPQPDAPRVEAAPVPRAVAVPPPPPPSAAPSALPERMVADELAQRESPKAGSPMFRMSTRVGTAPVDAEVQTFVAAALARDTLAALQARADLATRNAAAPELLHMDAWLRPTKRAWLLSGTSTAPADTPATPLAALDALVWPRRDVQSWRPQVEELAHRLVQHADDAALRERAIAYVQWLAEAAPDTESRAGWQALLETLRR